MNSSHSSHMSSYRGSNPFFNKPPQPSKLYLELKKKYNIETEYPQKVSSNYKSRSWDISRLWIDIISEKIENNEVDISYEIYEKCKNELQIVPRYELRFHCEICRLFSQVDKDKMNLIWKDILLKISEEGHSGDAADPLPSFVKLSYDLGKVNIDNKNFFINVISNTLNKPGMHLKLSLQQEEMNKYLKIFKEIK